MAQLTFFNPDTGEKLFEGDGQVFRTDQPDMINNGPWNNPQADPIQQLIDPQEWKKTKDGLPPLWAVEDSKHIKHELNDEQLCEKSSSEES